MTPLGTIELFPRPELGLERSTPSAPQRPCVKTIMGRLAVSLFIACVVPAVLFYVTLVVLNVSAAVVAALAWTYAAIGWRWATKRPMSGLLALTVVIMSVRTFFALATGDTFIYFFQPVVADVLVAAVFLMSLATARPVVARLAADFYPMDLDVATRPRVRRLFWHLTLMWALVCLIKGAVSFWLLQSQSLVNFVMIKNISIQSMTILAVAASVAASLTVARKEGLLAAA